MNKNKHYIAKQTSFGLHFSKAIQIIHFNRINILPYPNYYLKRKIGISCILCLQLLTREGFPQAS